MNKYRLQAEIWEIQIILYWILALLLFVLTPYHWIEWIVVAWSVVSVIGTFCLLIKAEREDKKNDN